MLAEINQYLHEHIPITHHMGVTVLHYDGQHVILNMPLEQNLNHRNTAFGGSISTLGILAGWTLLHLKFREESISPRLVIQHSETTFDEAVESDFQAVCYMPSAEKWLRFTKMLFKRSRARLSLESIIQVQQSLVARHKGDYVAVRTE